MVDISIYNYIAMEMYPRVIYNYIYYIAIIIITINYIYYIQWFSQISPVSRWLQSRGAKNISLFSVHSGGRAIAERLATIVQVPIEPTTHADLNFKHRLSNKKPWFIIVPIGSMYGIYANIWGILMVNVTIYSIHGSYGVWYPCNMHYL